MEEVKILIDSKPNTPLKIINPNKIPISIELKASINRYFERIPQRTWCNENSVQTIALTIQGESFEEASAPMFGSAVFINF